MRINSRCYKPGRDDKLFKDKIKVHHSERTRHNQWGKIRVAADIPIGDGVFQPVQWLLFLRHSLGETRDSQVC